MTNIKVNERFTKGSLNGGIHQMNSTNTFTGFTQTTSKTFKTYKGALRFLESKGYAKN